MRAKLCCITVDKTGNLQQIFTFEWSFTLKMKTVKFSLYVFGAKTLDKCMCNLSHSKILCNRNQTCLAISNRWDNANEKFSQREASFSGCMKLSSRISARRYQWKIFIQLKYFKMYNKLLSEENRKRAQYKIKQHCWGLALYKHLLCTVYLQSVSQDSMRTSRPIYSKYFESARLNNFVKDLQLSKSSGCAGKLFHCMSLHQLKRCLPTSTR